jgi:hypothetical protein
MYLKIYYIININLEITRKNHKNYKPFSLDLCILKGRNQPVLYFHSDPPEYSQASNPGTQYYFYADEKELNKFAKSKFSPSFLSKP